MTAAPECRATWLRGCRWRGRYDTTPPAIDSKGAAADLVKIIEASTRRTYVRDVCETCGATKERP